MRVILLGVALAMLWSQVSLATVTRASRLLLQSYRDAAWLQSEIDMLVARGYVLFKGSWHSEDESMESMGKRGIELVLIRDADSPAYRYAEQETVTHIRFPVEPPARSIPLDLQAIAEGRKHEIADGWSGGRGKRDVVSIDHMLSTTYSSDGLSQTDKLEQGWLHYTLQAENGSYPDIPADIDTLQLITDTNTVSLKAAGNYSIYQGERDGAWTDKYVETITIKAGSRTIYLHSLNLDMDGAIISERLSVGTVAKKTADLKSLTLVQETTVINEVFDSDLKNLNGLAKFALENRERGSSHDISQREVGTSSYELQLDDVSNMTLIPKYGNQKNKIQLQLIRDTDNK